MHCNEFLERHSEYVDGRLPAALVDRWRAHARVCRACGHYDSVVRRGGDLVREVLPHLTPSSDFEPRLQHRLFHVRDDLARRPARGLMAGVAIVLLAGGAAMGMALSPASSSPAVVIRPAAVTVATPVASAMPQEPIGAPAPAEPDLIGPATPVRVPSRADVSATRLAAHRPVHWPVYSAASYAAEFQPVVARAETGAARTTLLLNE